MAFTTIEGTGGAPWTFQGTSEPDQIAVITGDQVDSVAYSFEANGEEGDDTINWNGVRQVTIRGGQGDDVITNNVATGATAGVDLVTTSWINGNDGNDVIGNTQYGIAATISTISGGQADDTFYINNLQTSRVNGNLGDDELNIGESFVDAVNWANSSVFGGQGDDTINVTTAFANITDTTIAGQVGDDTITVLIDTGAADAAAGTLITGGDGEDTISAQGSTADLAIEGNAGADDITGGEGADTISGGDGHDSISGRRGADEISGESGDDTMLGGDGRDTISGADGDDVIQGDAGADTLSGGTQSNRFVQNAGSTNAVTRVSIANNNIITAGDRFFIDGGADVITDWDAAAGTNVLSTGVADNLVGNNANTMSLGFNYNFGGNRGVAQNYAVRGNYDEATQSFTVINDGSDIAVWTNFTGTAADFRDNFVVLDNVSADTTVSANQFVNVGPF